MSKNSFKVYKIQNQINGKSYVGQTTNSLEKRISEHRKCNKTPVQKAITKYGIENFNIIIIDYAESMDELNSKEEFWISFYNTQKRSLGYNIKAGGRSSTFSEEGKKLISKRTKEAMKSPEVRNKLGRVWTLEEKEKKSKQMSGRKLSEEHRLAISKALKGKKKSKEHGKNISKGKTGMKYNWKHKQTLESEGVTNE